MTKINVKKRAHQVFAANQRALFSVRGDASITSDGELTAGNTGGVVLVTVTSFADASKKVVIPVVVECESADIRGRFTGTMMPRQNHTPLEQWACAAPDAPVVFQVNPWTVAQGYLEDSYLACGTPALLKGGACGYSLEDCSIGCGELFSGCPLGNTYIGPDLTEPGMNKRAVSASVWAFRGAASVCTELFDGTGTVTKQ